MEIKPTYTYKDVSLVPRKLSRVRSRQDIDLSVRLTMNGKNIRLRMPILPAPMDTICGLEMCRAFTRDGMLGIIHRFKPAEERLMEYKILKDENMDAFVAVGLEEQKVVKQHYNLGARLFVVDIANGFNVSVEPIIRYMKEFGDTFVICGNVASKEGFEYLSNLGVDAIRVGIGIGSMCTTSVMTGIGQGIVSALLECKEAKDSLNSQSLIIADGGISNTGDITKALAIGADLAMMGRMFAGTKEAEGNILKYDGKLYKLYRGSASYAVQKKSGKNPYYVEGEETIVSYKGSVENVFDLIEAGLRSAFSYMSAHNMDEFRENVSRGVYPGNSLNS